MRVLFVSRERHRLPLDDVQRRKWDAIGAEVDLRVLAATAPGSPTSGDPRFRLAPRVRPSVFDGLAFYAALPLRVARELRAFRPDVVLVQGVHETALALVGRRIARSRAKVILDLHGDWRTATRLYGSRARRILSPLADALARVAIARADAIRALSPTTRELVRAEGREPAGLFAAYVDVEEFRRRPPQPLPERPCLLFVGVLERYKAVDTIVAAWRLAAPRVPAATLQLVGRGPLAPLVEALVRDLPAQTEWAERLEPPQIAAALDSSTALLLPSRSEGLPRVAIEALCRGRPVVGGRGGGTPDIVRDGENGLLVDPDDPQALADAMVRVLIDRELAGRLASGAEGSAAEWVATPEEFAQRLVRLFRQVAGGAADVP
jgi:glycosyltransferase involved in cell wall biosynthesis